MSHPASTENDQNPLPGVTTAKTWIHSRKGPITGHVIREDETWMWVRLAGDHRLRYGSEANRGRIDEAGDVMCLRRSYMTPTETDYLEDK